MSDKLNPYDTGKRAEPKPWFRGEWTPEDYAAMSPIERTIEEDRFGKVDFEDDEGRTVATVWIEKGADGEYVVHIADENPRIEVHGG